MLLMTIAFTTHIEKIIGLNTPITFSFSTGTLIAVPGGKIKGVGDKTIPDKLNPFIEETKGWYI